MPNRPDRSKSDEEREAALSFVCPLMSALLDRQQIQPELEKQQLKECGYVKQSLLRAKNGPLLLIICASCKNAQRIFEIISEIVALSQKLNMGSAKFRPLKPLLLQGGGREDMYEIPLINGCDILVAATPLVLLRMIGQGRTNLERLEYLAVDEAHLVLEKFPGQMRVLMSRYWDMLRINEHQSIAQLVLFSALCSTRLTKFIGAYLLDPAYIIANKLEAAHFGNTEHMIFDCSASSAERTSLKKLSKCLGKSTTAL
jgi:superfamily II DNA/RNA helicase